MKNSNKNICSNNWLGQHNSRAFTISLVDTSVAKLNTIGIRTFHSTAGHNNSNITPMVTYINADTDKFNILTDNKGKSGVYRFTNTKTGFSYIGSTRDLSIRLRNYFNVNYLLRYKSMVICRALLKHGYSHFTLEILEYCEPSCLIEREQYYLDLLNPEYNILKTAGSSVTNIQKKLSQGLEPLGTQTKLK
jgi:hypothetical protein